MKAQASIEYIVIFGTVMAIILVGFFVFQVPVDIEKLISSQPSCIFYGGTKCTDVNMTHNNSVMRIDLLITNGKGFNINNISLTATECSGKYTASTLLNGNSLIAVISGCPSLSSGSSFRTTIEMSYTHTKYQTRHLEQGAVVVDVP